MRLFFLFLFQATVVLALDASKNKDDLDWYKEHPNKHPHAMTAPERQNFIQWKKEQKRAIRAVSRPASPRAIAEFEPMQSVLISYHNFSQNELGFDISFVKLLADEIEVVIAAAPSAWIYLEDQLRAANVQMNNITHLPQETDSYWSRDYGAWWIKEGRERISIVDFIYNRPRYNDNTIPEALSQFLGDVPLYLLPMVQCGGNFMCDGFESASSTDLVLEENQDLSEDSLTSLMKEYLGIENYHIRPDPLGDYIKHIDCWGKYLAPDKILIAEVEGEKKQAFDSAAAYFETVTSPYGTPYKVYRVFSQGEPYTNSLILNDRVFVPLQGTMHDDPALEVYREAMPGYSIIGVYNNTGNPWLTTDALHCRSRGIADLSMVDIQHMPVTGTISSSDGYAINSIITAYSESNLIFDSLQVHYKTGSDSTYSRKKLFCVNDSLFTANIPNSGFGNDTISYYITAVDSNGNRASFPFRGEDDPVTFYGINSSLHTTPSYSERRRVLDISPREKGINFRSIESGTIRLFRANGALIKELPVYPGENTFIDSNILGSGVFFYSFKGKAHTKHGQIFIP